MPRGRAGAWSARYKPSSTIYIKYLLQTSFHKAVLSLLKVLSLMVYCSEKTSCKIWDASKEKTKLSKTDKSIQMCSSDPKCVFLNRRSVQDDEIVLFASSVGRRERSTFTGLFKACAHLKALD